MLLAVAGEAAAKAGAVTADNPLLPWRGDVRVHPVSATPNRHTIHSYYVCNPESPDGRRVLYYASTAANGYVGDLCMLERQTGRETVLARDVHVEDAHRAACQQWISGGRRVAFHEVRDGRWRVVVIGPLLAAIRPAPGVQRRRAADLLQRQQRRTYAVVRRRSAVAASG